MPVTLSELLAIAARARASDLHITADAAPLMRVDGDLKPVPQQLEPLDAVWVREAARRLAGSGCQTAPR